MAIGGALIRVLVVDDEPPARAKLRRWLPASRIWTWLPRRRTGWPPLI